MTGNGDAHSNVTMETWHQHLDWQIYTSLPAHLGPVTRKFSGLTLVLCSAYGGLRTLVRAQRFLGVTRKFSGWARVLNCCHARFSDVTDDNRPSHNQQSTARFTKNAITLWRHILEGTSHILWRSVPFAWHFFVTFVWLEEVAFNLNHVHYI